MWHGVSYVAFLVGGKGVYVDLYMMRCFNRMEYPCSTHHTYGILNVIIISLLHDSNLLISKL